MGLTAENQAIADTVNINPDLGGYIAFIEPDLVCLDGDFCLSDLKKIVSTMEKFTTSYDTSPTAGNPPNGSGL